MNPNANAGDSSERERDELLERLREWMELPLIFLGFAWLVLLVLELVRGLSPFLAQVVNAIWIVFIVAFLIELALAPRKLAYLRSNWLTALSLAVPALRVFRIFRALRVLRAARAVRGARLVRVVASLNRGSRALGRVMERRGFGYVVLLTTVVTLAGAAGMLGFERGLAGSRIDDYGSALWWTAMIMTTLGSAYWPVTVEGRILCVLLAIYAFAVFGYVTASLASFFIGRDAERDDAELAGQQGLARLHEEIAGLRAELRSLAGRL